MSNVRQRHKRKMPFCYQRSGKKYGNKKITVDGETFDSKKEYNRYCELKLLERAKIISNLRRQVPFLLIPSQYETLPTGEYYKRGEKKGQPKYKEVCIEQSLVYYADFVYQENDKTVVEDIKGYREPSSAGYAKFVIKRKLMLWTHGIRIKEI